VYGYPIDQATRIALSTVASHLEASALPERVVFCCFSAIDAEVYEHVAAECLSR
jgi:O-acetyl-ADP-ribose deacetylase (regulator of RNase III)